ncbi:penicillin-binding protein 2 [Streptomyces pactum]|uniref:Penicillin-binding protein 2 n=1 Tax=Streptomyces pactum TaxID=68249 RepID=A0ABS0NP55_9ACTN|nr:penicillin-binding transpeptidase domain-containing protein [Streptomyces pactum]MBH5336980.1 penicillin-binding protein 2 [Streptomyces pactum]
MNRRVRRLAAFCVLLLVALLANAGRIQTVDRGDYAGNPADRRPAIARYGQPRGDILAGTEVITGSRDTGQRLRYERTYPDGPLWAPVTGFASQRYGTSLLEAAEDELLAGTDARLDPFPLWRELTGARHPGGSVRTTVLPAAQRAAFAALAGRAGAVAALEPATGKILALVSSPGYDPGELSGNGPAAARAWERLAADPGRPMLNRALGRTYPPGSTFKIVTAAAALEHGVVTDVDAPTDAPSPYVLPGTVTPLRDAARGCARASLHRAIVASCNTVLARLGVRTGLDRMAATARDFGFDQDGLTVPSPVARSTFGTGIGDEAQLALSSIGQYDTAATPLQMAMVAAAVAADGDLMRPYLVDRVTDSRGRTVASTPPVLLHRPVSPRTAAELRRMMVDAVRHGTGSRAALPGATVGGKTGTAQHGVDNTRTPYAWFIGWARRDGEPGPEAAVAVVLEEAAPRRDDIAGGGQAAPVARAVLEAVLRDRAAGRH